MMGEHPHVSQFVREDGIELLCAQALEELVLDREPEGLASIGRCFNRHDECDLRLYRDVDVVGNPQFCPQAIDDQLNAQKR